MPEGFQQFHSMGGGGGGGMPRGFSARFGGNNFTQRKASNIQYIINITLEEGFNGVKKDIIYNITNNNKHEEKKETIEMLLKM